MRNPFFILGCGRSGTTLLRLMLDSHRDLTIPGESHFITRLWERRHAYQDKGKLQSERLARSILESTHFKRWSIPTELVWQKIAGKEATFANVISAIFEAYAEASQKLRWGDKTPIYVRRIPVLLELFPDAQFIHIIRDGRNVAMSYLSVPWGPRNIWSAAWKWQFDVSRGMRDGRPLGMHRYREVRYEDLILKPEITLRELCLFIGADYDPAMLEYHRTADRRLHAGPGGERFHMSVTRPPTRGLREWRADMRTSDIMNFESIAGSLLEKLGYERSCQQVPELVRFKGSCIKAALDMKYAGSRFSRRIRNSELRS